MSNFLMLLLILQNNIFADANISNSNIICSREAYNCPSYSGKYQQKRLKTCGDVKLVWVTCGLRDPHGLDKDKDLWPCEKDCSQELFKK